MMGLHVGVSGKDGFVNQRTLVLRKSEDKTRFNHVDMSMCKVHRAECS